MTGSLSMFRSGMFAVLMGLALFSSVLGTMGAEKRPVQTASASPVSDLQVVEVAPREQASQSKPEAKARAAIQYYAAKVRNNLKFTISYQYSVNGSAWKTVTLRPGYEHMYYFNLPLKGATDVYVRFDSRLNDGKLTFTTSKLKFWGCGHPSYGWLHGFSLVNDMLTVALMG